MKINWNYFDPNNGFSFQVIYLGNENPKSKLNGKVFGVSTFQELNSKTEIPKWSNFLAISICFIFGWFADAVFPKVLGKQSSLGIYWRIFIVLAISIIINYIFITVLNKLYQPQIPF